eukprot:m.86086 g.86086  ORF g.86086 m.86086 type:complete len:219 (+) comp36487_c1_seq1:759-1415(+)
MNLASYFVFLALIETSFAVVCYHCSTNGNVTCNATVGNDTTTMNCANNSEYCTASLSSGVYTRGCGASCNKSATGVETKCCMMNKCNGDFDKIVDGGGENTTAPTNGTIPAPTNRTTSAPTNGTTPVPLQCYTCSSSSDCSTTKTVCQSNEKYCRTSTITVPIFGTSVQKTCEVDCTPSSGGGSGEVKCCQVSLCNAGSTVSIGFLALLLALLSAFVV